VADNKSQGLLPFGQALRAKRLEKKYGLRQFAELVGVSPTYLSRVEQCNVMPPAADRINRMAELLGMDADEWMALAGRVSDEVSGIISEYPTEIPDLLRTLRGLTPSQIRKLRDVAEQMKDEPV
jgi:HTH-type transcriptional regulator, competence development regulator